MSLDQRLGCASLGPWGALKPAHGFRTCKGDCGPCPVQSRAQTLPGFESGHQPGSPSSKGSGEPGGGRLGDKELPRLRPWAAEGLWSGLGDGPPTSLEYPPFLHPQTLFSISSISTTLKQLGRIRAELLQARLRALLSPLSPAWQLLHQTPSSGLTFS